MVRAGEYPLNFTIDLSFDEHAYSHPYIKNFVIQIISQLHRSDIICVWGSGPPSWNLFASAPLLCKQLDTLRYGNVNHHIRPDEVAFPPFFLHKNMPHPPRRRS